MRQTLSSYTGILLLTQANEATTSDSFCRTKGSEADPFHETND